ncbi:MAG: 4-alpha-glucanotransferase [Planctomycetota bacterium]
MRSAAAERAELRRLARSWGVQSAYVDTEGRRRVAAPEALMAVLRALGVPVHSPADASRLPGPDDRRRCIVAWNGRFATRWPRSGRARPKLELVLEDGAVLDSPVDVEARDDHWHLRARRPLPIGVHAARFGGGPDQLVHILSAPRRCVTNDRRDAGIFVPTSALRSRHDWGCGDLAGLGALTAWAGERGLRWVGTLPLLPCFLDEPFDPSPYSPVSRLFWGELFVDLDDGDGLEADGAVRAVLGDDNVVAARRTLRRRQQVDYRAVMQLKRRVLGAMADAAFRNDTIRTGIERLARTDRDVEAYARFRATVQQRRVTWLRWPARLRDGRLRDGDYREEDRRVHVLAQWMLRRQLGRLRQRGNDAALYLDLPLGVHGGGYDTWRHPEQFALGVTVGAPPDTFFPGGQNWGFPPLRPAASHHGAHAYFRAAVAHHLSAARMLRVDHVMGLHRLFWIPEGLDATDGVYVRYPAEELYAVLAIESHRHDALIVGENLGTVPEVVDRSLDRHGVRRMHAAQFGFAADSERAVTPPPRGGLACLNTHDMATFAAFWRDEDLELRRRLHVGTAEDLRRERAGRVELRSAIKRFLTDRGRLRVRRPDTRHVLWALLDELAASDAGTLLIALEDCWEELRPQNVPGITSGYPCWRRKIARSLRTIVADRDLSRRLERVATRTR